MMIIVIFSWFLKMLGLVVMAFVWLIFMEVVLCRDALSIDAKKILTTSFKVRRRVFRRSWKNMGYRAALLGFIGLGIWLKYRIGQIASNTIDKDPSLSIQASLISIILPLCLYCFSRSHGYKSTFVEELIKDFYEWVKDCKANILKIWKLIQK